MDLAFKAAVPEASGPSEESELYISALVEAIVVVDVWKSTGTIGGKALIPMIEMTLLLHSCYTPATPLLPPPVMPIPEAAAPLQASIYGPMGPRYSPDDWQLG